MKSFLNHQRRNILTVLIVLGINTHPFSFLHAMEDPLEDDAPSSVAHKPKPALILALDGGGARGLATAKILQNIEEALDKKLGTAKPISDAFDLFGGTSTGGLISLMLASKFPISECVNLYKTQSPKIFSATWGHTLKTGYGLWGPKYDAAAGLEPILDEILKQTRLCDAKKPVFVTTFDPKNNELLLLDSIRAQTQDPGYSAITMKEAARATTAAPTYFSASTLSVESLIPSDLDNDPFINILLPSLTVIDGGVAANDPAQLALSRAQEIYPARSIFLVSIGTGESPLPTMSRQEGIVQFTPSAINTLLNGATTATEAALEMELPHNYYRLQFTESAALDDTSPATLQRLEEEADALSKTTAFINLIERLSTIFKEE